MTLIDTLKRVGEPALETPGRGERRPETQHARKPSLDNSPLSLNAAVNLADDLI
jgi:hypothetical protein